MIRRSSTSVGIIVSRFQVEKLHKGHIALINYVRERHEDVVIMLGVHGGVRTQFDPLTFTERKIMVQQSVRCKLIILPMPDHPFSHDIWSENLDNLIAETYPGRETIIYGSRDGIADPEKKGRTYTGKLT